MSDDTAVGTARAGALADKYAPMLRLADLFTTTGDDLRTRARLGAEVLTDPDVADSAELSRATWADAETEIRGATTGEHGLLTRGIELDADALAVQATVQTYRWIDELQDAAYKTLGTIAGRAIGYLAPEVALGGAVVSAGLIETDALDRDGVAQYLSELAANNPDLMAHVTSGGGGLLDGLSMRSLLTVGILAGDTGGLAAVGGLRAAGVDHLTEDFGSALRDVAGGFVSPPRDLPPGAAVVSTAPAGLEALMVALHAAPAGVHVEEVGEHRYIAYLAGPGEPVGLLHDPLGEPRVPLVAGDHTEYVALVARAIDAAVGSDPQAQLLLVGSGQGGVAAAEVAAGHRSDAFVVDHVVTAGAPSAQVRRLPDGVRMLSLEDRSDPVALLGSLINAGDPRRLTVVVDAAGASGVPAYVAAGRAADAATHPTLVAEIGRLVEAGYLAG